MNSSDHSGAAVLNESEGEASEFEEILLSSAGNVSEIIFDETVGVLEDMLLGDHFSATQNAFLDAHCHEFSDHDENSHSNMERFNEYVELMEKFITSFLCARIPNFDLERFCGAMEKNGGELDGDVFDVLNSISDFSHFKDLMLSRKHCLALEEDLENCLTITSGF